MHRHKFLPIFLLFVATSLGYGPSASAANIFSLVNWLGGGMGVPVPIPSLGGLGSTAKRSTGQPAMTPRYQAIVLAHQGYLNDQAGKHDAARQMLEQAIQADPTYELAWSNLMIEYQLTGNLQQAVDLGNQYLLKFPHGSQRAKVSGLLSNARVELDREEKVAQSLGPTTAEDYLPMTSEDGVLKHWPVQAMPLRVFITDGTGVRGYQPEMANVLISSFKEWSFVSNNRISFVPVPNAEQAQIVCNWVDDAKKFPGGLIRYGECGLAIPQYYPDGTICSAQVYCLTVNKSTHQPFSLRAIHGVCLHEIGHALGLIGHSDRPGDIMYFTGDNEPKAEPHVSWRDVNTIDKLYDIALSGAPMCQSQVVASTNINVDNSMVPGGSQGLVGYTPSTPFVQAALPAPPQAESATPGYMRAEYYASAPQQFISNKEAIAYFEAAVSRSPDTPIFLDDLGSAYNNRAAELASEGNMDSSLSFLERALAIHKNSTDRSRLDSTLSNYMILLVKQGRLAEAQNVYRNYQQGTAPFPQ